MRRRIETGCQSLGLGMLTLIVGAAATARLSIETSDPPQQVGEDSWEPVDISRYEYDGGVRKEGWIVTVCKAPGGSLQMSRLTSTEEGYAHGGVVIKRLDEAGNVLWMRILYDPDERRIGWQRRTFPIGFGITITAGPEARLVRALVGVDEGAALIDIDSETGGIRQSRVLRATPLAIAGTSERPEAVVLYLSKHDAQGREGGAVGVSVVAGDRMYAACWTDLEAGGSRALDAQHFPISGYFTKVESRVIEDDAGNPVAIFSTPEWSGGSIRVAWPAGPGQAFKVSIHRDALEHENDAVE